MIKFSFRLFLSLNQISYHVIVIKIYPLLNKENQTPFTGCNFRHIMLANSIYNQMILSVFVLDKELDIYTTNWIYC